MNAVYGSPPPAEPRRRAADRERAALIKARLSIDDALAALGLDTDLGIVSPCCDAIGAMSVNQKGDGARCGFCGEGFDAIKLVQCARDEGFYAACRFLEEEAIPKRRDAKTGDLFGKRGRG